MPYRMTPSVRHRAIEVHYYYYYYYYYYVNLPASANVKALVGFDAPTVQALTYPK